MKHTIYLLLVLALAACSDRQSEQTINDSGPVDRLVIPGDRKNVVLISGDEEYRSEEALPQLAAILSKRHGFNCTVLFAQDTAKLGIADPNYLTNIPGLETLEEADLMVIFTRFRALPDEQMVYIDQYLAAGKPVIGIRTATHAFNFKDSISSYTHYSNNFNDNNGPWQGGFGRLVLGEKWISHHGWHKHQSTRGIIPDSVLSHPILKGIASDEIWTPTDVYGVRLPMQENTRPLVFGQVTDRLGEYIEEDLFFGMTPEDSIATLENGSGEKTYNPNDPIMPVAWTKTYQLPGGNEGISFTTTMGASSDLMNEALRRLFVNASYYLTGLDVPEKADVELVGDYSPTQFSFHTDEYWDEMDIKIQELDSIYNN